MFGEIFQFVKEVAELLWPFRIVMQYERAAYYVCGHYWREMGPGLKFVLPWFFEVKEVSIADAMLGTGRLDITLSNGTTLSFAATAWAKVEEVSLAINSVDEYRQTAQELLCSVLSDELAKVEPERLAPDRRSRLLKSLETSLNNEGKEFGVKFSKVRFKSFVIVSKALRLLIDQTTADTW